MLLKLLIKLTLLLIEILVEIVELMKFFCFIREIELEQLIILFSKDFVTINHHIVADQ